MPYYSSRRRRRASWRLQCRFLALLLGGLFLVTFNCGALLHGPGHTHGATHPSSGVSAQEAHHGTGAEHSAEAGDHHHEWDDPCSVLGHGDEDQGRTPASPSLPSPVAVLAVAVAVPVVGRARLTCSQRPRAQPVRSRLTFVCRWII